jgi:hypothetical protein
MTPGNYSDYTLARESSGGNRFAKNPRSTALGPHQFIDETWARYVRSRPDLGLTMDGRTDPEQSKRAFNALTEDNAKALAAAGHPTDNRTLYMAHHFGSGGALKLLSAGPDALIENVLGSKVIEANPHLRGKTVAQFDSPKGSTQVNPYAPTQPALSAGATLGEGVLYPGVRDNASVGGGFENGLMGAAAALAGISSPQQAASLLAMQRQNTSASQWSQHFDPKTGTVFRINNRTGQLDYKKVGPGEPDDYTKAVNQASAKADVEFGQKLLTDADTARNGLVTTQRMIDIANNPNVHFGAGGEMALGLRKMLAATGYDVSGVKEGDEFRAYANHLTAMRTKMLSGALSEKELKFITEAGNSLNMGRDANLELLRIGEKAQRRMLETAELADQYRQQTGRLDQAGFSKFARDKWVAEDAASAQTAPAATAAPTGVITFVRGADGKIIRK